jgi:hypothetical protein
VRGLEHANYAAHVFRDGEAHASDAIKFQDAGFVYGPIRLSAPKDGPVYRTVVEPAVDQCLSSGSVGLVMVRDPRDVLISEYYSFGLTHSLSKRPEIARVQLQIRERIKQMSLDEYTLDRAPVAAANFLELRRIADNCRQGTILKYEDLVEHFDRFAAQLTRWVDLDDETIARMYEESRPRSTEIPNLHKRSGRVRAYLEKLQPATIRDLNHLLGEALASFDYC